MYHNSTITYRKPTFFIHSWDLEITLFRNFQLKVKRTSPTLCTHKQEQMIGTHCQPRTWIKMKLQDESRACIILSDYFSLKQTIILESNNKLSYELLAIHFVNYGHFWFYNIFSINDSRFFHFIYRSFPSRVHWRCALTIYWRMRGKAIECDQERSFLLLIYKIRLCLDLHMFGNDFASLQAHN